jgi:hypothetical protein
MRGTASLVVGMMAETIFMKTVSDSRIVTSKQKIINCYFVKNFVESIFMKGRQGQ